VGNPAVLATAAATLATSHNPICSGALSVQTSVHWRARPRLDCAGPSQGWPAQQVQHLQPGRLASAATGHLELGSPVYRYGIDSRHLPKRAVERGHHDALSVAP
jgi:hypothetical protein